jgi:hypothetical protein
MKYIPNRVLEIMENEENVHDEEKIIYNNEYFLILEDVRHNKKSYHYTAWIKKDIRSLIEINQEILYEIVNVQNYLLENNIIESSHVAFIHFPPQFWRLHIHFVQDNHKFKAPHHEIIKIDDIIKYYNKDKNYFSKNIVLDINDNMKIQINNDVSHQKWLL